MKSRLVTAVIFAAAGLLAAPFPAGGAGSVRIETNFDNPRVRARSGGERHLEIEVIAPGWDRPLPARRPPLNIALVIDKSGSMAEAGKMNFVKRAAAEMVGRLRPGDRFAVVAYDDGVDVLIRSEPMEDTARAERLIGRLAPGGSTNLGAGLLEGYAQVRRHRVEGGVNRVLLLSDGLANRGVTSPAELSRVVGREAARGASLSTFGVGLDFNEDLLSSLAEGGRGTYYYIDQPGRIREILAREFSFIERVVALDVRITIEAGAGIDVRDVMGYDWRREGGRCIVRLGDMAAGERRRVMVRLGVPALGEGEHPAGGVGLSYRLPGTDRETKVSKDLRLRYLSDEDDVGEGLNRDVAERSAVFEANSARYEAAKMVDRGDHDEARRLLEESRRKLEAAPVQSPAVRDEIAETEAYGQALEAPADGPERESAQKRTKYRSYQILQSK